ncbi:MAG: lysophospholipid acyltransferase family protein [Puniceicoccaceae bacterium]
MIAFWHQHLFVAPELHRRFRGRRKIGGMVSASRDGSWLAAFFSSIGVEAVRGSQGGLSLSATKAAIRRLGEGVDIAITPDGSRGPIHVAKPGALFICRESKCSLCLVKVEYNRKRQLQSWDRFIIPLPWSLVQVSGQIHPWEGLPGPDEDPQRWMGQALG